MIVILNPEATMQFVSFHINNCIILARNEQTVEFSSAFLMSNRVWFYFLISDLLLFIFGLSRSLTNSISSSSMTSTNLLVSTLEYKPKDPFKRIKHVGQTLPNIARWCWTVFDQCWIMLELECSNESNIIQQCWISVPGTKLWRIFNHVNKNVGRCWMKSLNKDKLPPSPSNTI